MKNHILEISKSIKKKELALFCGAGVSKNSGLPLANELKQYVLEKLLLDKEDMDEIMNSNLPFEAFFEEISENTDISKLLDIFQDGKPNANHILIARLVKNGYLKTIFTTNFDLFIEKALEKEGLNKNKDFKVYYDEEQFSRIDLENLDEDKLVRIFKIHGSIEDKDSIRTTLKAVASRTLSSRRMNAIRYLFSTGSHEKVLVLGYSCSDEFDVTPQIQSIEENRKEIIFIDHSDIEKIEDIRTKNFGNPYKRFPGIRIMSNTERFIENLWHSVEDVTKQEYKLNKSQAKWRKYVDDWAGRLEENKEDLKYFIAGSIFFKISNFKKAIKYWERSLEIARGIRNKAGESTCRMNLGIAYQGLGDFKKAIEHFEEALEIAKDIGYKAGQSRCYTNLGTAYQGLGDFKKAIEYLEKSLSIKKEIGDKLGESKCYLGLGNVYQGLGDFKKAIGHHERSLEITAEIGDKSGESACYINLGNAYLRLGDFKKAIEYHQESLEIKIETGNRAGESSCYVDLGNAYRGLGDFKKAIKYYEKSLEIAIEIGDKVEESTCYINLGVAYHGVGDFNKAVRYYWKSLGMKKEIGDKPGESKCYGNLGNACRDLGDLKRAIKYYLNAEKIFKERGQIHHLKTLYNSLSLAYRDIGDYKNAEKYKRLHSIENLVSEVV